MPDNIENTPVVQFCTGYDQCQWTKTQLMCDKWPTSTRETISTNIYKKQITCYNDGSFFVGGKVWIKLLIIAIIC